MVARLRSSSWRRSNRLGWEGCPLGRFLAIEWLVHSGEVSSTLVEG